MAESIYPTFASAAKPTLLRDVLRMKRERGDADSEIFKKAVCGDFAVKLNATIGGAIWAYGCWIKKADKLGWSMAKVESRKAILAELEAIQSGTFFIQNAA